MLAGQANRSWRGRLGALAPPVLLGVVLLGVVLLGVVLLGVVLLGVVSGCKGGKSDSKALKLRRAELHLIDSHVHLTPLPGPMNVALRLFAELHIDKFAVKSAGTPGTPRYAATLRWAQRLGERMAFFTNLDWDGIDDPGWGQREADRIEEAMRDGASGIKIFKALGLGVRLVGGKLLAVDDHRLDPIFERCGKLGAIVAWHVADPVAFFEPVTPQNERYGELSLAPSWSFHGQDYPSHDALLAARDRVLARFPKTIFLGIHLANYPEQLSYVEKTLERFPNLYVDISARVPEIGRHPVPTVQAFFRKFADRILFGSDLIITPRSMQLGSVSKGGPPTYDDALKFYRVHRRFFETADRDFDHPTPSQGDWKINGVDLPYDVLKKVYYDNADKLIFAPRRVFLARQRARRPPVTSAPSSQATSAPASQATSTPASQAASAPGSQATSAPASQASSAPTR